jgi:phosphatidylinositol alpha-1,6-mannosyltransferase
VLPRKILLVTNDLGPRAGGIETFLLGLLDQLDGRQIVIYTAFQLGSDEFDRELQGKTGVIVIRDKNSILLPNPFLNRRIRSVMQSYGSEIIWFGAAMPLAWMSALLKRGGAKRIVALTHGHEVWWAKLPPFRWIFSRTTKSIDVLTYLGAFTRTAIAPIVNKSCELIQIAPGIPIDHFTPGSKSTRLQKDLRLEGRRVLISVGRLVHRKGQDKLLEALPAIVRQHPDVVLVFVGVGPRQKKLDQLIERYKLSEYVRFVGRVSYQHLPEYFRLGDLFVMPSRSRLAGLEVEGLGIVYLEASACGIPVVAGASGGAPDAVIEGTTGLVVDGTSVEAIAQTINELLDQPARMWEMGLAGRAWTVERWGWQIWGQRFSDVLFGDKSIG